MASVTSLGLHYPTALQYLQQEHLLSEDPAPDTYEWQTIANDDEGIAGYDELVTTKTCVVWCRGGIVRKSFRFEIEDEPVTQALLTSFSTEQQKTDRNKSDSADSKSHHLDAEPTSTLGEEHCRSKALVVFLRTQAHIYFLSGTSHIVHLPFEVEFAIASTNGLIIQRKLQSEKLAPMSLKFPRVPPNSFMTSQPQPWSAASSIQSTFSIASLGSPQQLNLPPTSLLGDLWQSPPRKDDSRWPRLFSLTDPLAELGLVVTSAKLNGPRRSSLRAVAIDPADEIIHVTDPHNVTETDMGVEGSVTLAVTLNRDTSMYTVWTMEYVNQEEPLRKPSRTTEVKPRRRSSFMPGTGATTPVANSQHTLRESFGGAGTIGAGIGMLKPSKRREDGAVEQNIDFVSSLDPDSEINGVPRRKSRRVSSMLARGDLSASASHDRSMFSEMSTAGQQPNPRIDSIGGHNGRASFGLHKGFKNSTSNQIPLNASVNSFLEAPIDDLLEELKAGGDFEGFHNMGLEDEDFEGLKKEVVFTKIESIPAERSNLRYSTQHKSAQSQCRVFTLSAPSSSLQRNQIFLCILDPEEKKFVVVTLNSTLSKKKRTPQGTQKARKQHADGSNGPVVNWSDVVRADHVIDACKVFDGGISRILVLSETTDGFGELTLQAPWGLLMKISVPGSLVMNNILSLGYSGQPPEESRTKALSSRPRALRGLRNSLPGGMVDTVDEEGRLHQLHLRMEARLPLVKNALDACKYVLPNKGGEALLTGWWIIRQWLTDKPHIGCDDEWSALIVSLLILVLPFRDLRAKPLRGSPRKHRAGSVRTGRTVDSATKGVDDILHQECSMGNSLPSWALTSGWDWLRKEDNPILSTGPKPSTTSSKAFNDDNSFLQRHVNIAQEYLNTALGDAAIGADGYLPTAHSQSIDLRKEALTQIISGLHLLHEERKLNIATVDSLTTGNASLAPVLSQMCRWIGWNDWADSYDIEDAVTEGIAFNSANATMLVQPSLPPSIYDWIEKSLTVETNTPFMTLTDVKNMTYNSDGSIIEQESSFIIPRTSLFKKLFTVVHPSASSIEIVEALYAAGFTTQVLDTLPEALLTPFREALIDCQSHLQVSWGRELLSLVGREDVNMLLFPEQKERVAYASPLAPTHKSTNDVHSVCLSLSEQETVGAFDGSAEVDRQSISRLIFKDDRRLNEAAKILNTSKPTLARCEPEPDWSESDLLEAQKVHVQELAIRTLAVPPGRGLLYFSARVPLLTEKFPIGGFNLHCVFKPANNTVGVDKNAFTEEKVCWAFFHAGVSAGLGISRQARGIDTSWILYNKPQELSNRHAGFLLALGLNGHLKCVAKWVAFKYLTPKHTMTSIGLLLGLAASYLGTMDSLITRLLSVHVTRMLPPGAAELNLSPLTQTTGIMGIGLLYCNTQHRRMSEIMLSEIEHIETEVLDEPLRNEGYRLAAGFALGFINLGKGFDLRGLHDMQLTERLLKLAVGSKKVNLVHVLDKATAGAVIAIALIFMKSEDHALARKIDVPSSILQFDYIRPDTFLLRTLATHLIMWSKIEATSSWIQKSLPREYRSKSSLTSVHHLSAEDLPFYNIIGGLCFSIALRHSGTGDLRVRDLLVHYLDQFMRICALPASNYDQKLARNTIRNCQDLLALCAATVMAGSGDLVVFRRLRVLRGRDDNETPYGSHMAAHVAIGALFLAGGTHTFGTSNLAIAALMVAFYPIFPTSILDNKSHLQAFRHFWVLATEARCVVARDIDTNMPVSIPLEISLRTDNDSSVSRHAPCLLPEIDSIISVGTESREFWNVVLDFEKNPDHLKAFKSTQTIYVRRRPAYDASAAAFHATLQALDDTDGADQHPLEWLFELPAFSMLTTAERALVIPPEGSVGRAAHTSTEGTLVDVRLVLEEATLHSGKRDRLQGLKLLFEWASMMQRDGREMQWVRQEVVDRLRAKVWMMSIEGDDEHP
ncbi:Anaphase-promoting complex subunit 1 [Pseudogymnoascus australis]